MHLLSRLISLFALPFVAVAAPVSDSPLLHSVIAPAGASAGSTVEVQLAVLNRSAAPVDLRPPGPLFADLLVAGNRWAISLRPIASSPSDTAPILAPGAFALRRYAIVLPVSAAPGAAVLEIRLPDGNLVRAALDIVNATGDSESPAVANSTQRPPTALVRAEPAAAALRRTFADRLGTHEPVYFIYGPDAPAAKFQYSFKYKLLDFTDVAPQRMMRSVQFAFTQRSLWDIEADSSPFYDTSYMPELIYESLTPAPEKKGGGFTWLGVQAAFRHESNGRDGSASRSLNVVYARTPIAFGQLEGWHLLVIPEVFAYVTSVDDNPRIKAYRGHGRLNLVLGRNDGPSLMLTTWADDDFENVSLQLDLTFPFQSKLLNFETYWLIQYFDGYGESLRSYDQKSQTVRAGISLVR